MDKWKNYRVKNFYLIYLISPLFISYFFYDNIFIITPNCKQIGCNKNIHKFNTKNLGVQITVDVNRKMVSLPNTL